MTHYDVFNGDADGICALLQLRLAEAKPDAVLVTGIKRDINLLKKFQPKAGDSVTVLDVSFDKNRKEVIAALELGANIFYVDHHFSGEIPKHPNLETQINTTADVCTSILVNHYLSYQYILWAIVGAFGDNLKNSAAVLCKKAELNKTQMAELEDLGIYINYNGYGASTDDLHFHPARLYQLLLDYPNPLDFIEGNNCDFEKLASGYKQDMKSATELSAHHVSNAIAVFLLPNEAWARRVSGVFGNELANQSTQRAHAVLTLKDNANYLVSIRAPLDNKVGADVFCRRYETGGGRAAAAGINDLPAADLNQFITDFELFYNQ